MIKNKYFTTILLLTLLSFLLSGCGDDSTASLDATLIGGDIQGSINAAGFDWSSARATAGADVEFSAILTNLTVLADFTSDTVTLSYKNTSQWPDITVPEASFVFNDIAWLNEPRVIIGLTEISNSFPSATSFVTSFNTNSVQIDVPLTNTNSGDFFSVTYKFNTEPGSLQNPNQ